MESFARAAWENAEPRMEMGRTKTDYIRGWVLHKDGEYTFTVDFYGYGVYNGKETMVESDRSSMWGRGYGVPLSSLKPGDFTPMTKEEAKKRTIQSVWGKSHYRRVYGMQSLGEGFSTIDDGLVTAGDKSVSKLAQSLIGNLGDDDVWSPEKGSTMPLHFLGKEGYIVRQLGTVLEQDRIPAIKQAAYMQVRHEITPNLGIGAFYLRALGGNTHTFRAANGTGNDVDTFDTLANVIGVGARYRLTKNAALSFDYGANYSDFGRYMNGHTRYEHKAGTSDFTIKGRERGTTPTFWVMRLDVGQADMDVAGSWNAFIDYKRFEHGSFFGGNVTESLPDRYLDGIKSFTIGAGYVPVQNLMVEAFYTFGAKGINTRDTLYGAERFRLGDYARLQVTYRF